jgi:oxygen-independent coproporphyrinogen-3 oxidase
MSRAAADGSTSAGGRTAPGGAALDQDTEVGSYFISNYPPYSFWKREHLADAEAALDRPPPPDLSLGLYLHVPFCRKRCKFCYFRVYTDKNSRDIEDYVDALAREVALHGQRPAFQGRPLRFVYFGGGTPSYLSTAQLRSLVERLRLSVAWDGAEEVTFECEPGTLSRAKVGVIKEIGVTRVSLGIENFDDAILEENGRAHLSEEIFRAYDWIRDAGFASVNVDLIAGMVGETDATWDASVGKAIALSPDSVTIYQMELPFNTVYSREILGGGKALPVAGWREKREWTRRAFEAFEAAGYSVSSGYTLVRDPASCRFSYRDHLWRGADMLGTGVASFSHVGGVHFQNLDRFEDYVQALREGRLPLNRALAIDPGERLVRELILQLKLGRLDAGYFRRKFGREILEDFREAFGSHRGRGWLDWRGDQITLTRAGLLQVDALLPAFFQDKYRGARYT